MSTIMLKNLQLIGNCIGQTSDLQNALNDYAAGKLDVTLDSIYSGDQVAEFFERTYTDSNRFGKVVYQYE